MRTKLRILAVALIAGGTMFAQPRLSIGIGVGGHGPAIYPYPAYAQYAPPCPGPDYTWADGYWAPQGARNVWIAGYWRRPFAGGYRVAPRYVEPRYYSSYRGYDNRGRERNESRGHGYSNGFRR